MSRLTRDGTAETVSRDQILRYERGLGNIHFPCSADHEQDWQPYPVDLYSAISDDHTYSCDHARWTVEPVSRDQILGRERRQGNINFPCSADHVQDWQPYPCGPCSCYVYWPCAGGLSAVNAIGTQLREPINSELTRWRMVVLYK